VHQAILDAPQLLAASVHYRAVAGLRIHFHLFTSFTGISEASNGSPCVFVTSAMQRRHVGTACMGLGNMTPVSSEQKAKPSVRVTGK
jgi:Asp-tRNA(Asn)/Glu-tRNA(Gln) amidotransferase B subunit